MSERFFTIDTHCDAATTSLDRPGWDIGARHARATDGSQVDLPRMEEGGLDAVGLAVFVTQAARTPRGWAQAHDTAWRALERAREAIARYPARAGVALTADDGPRLKAAGRRAFYLALENSYSLGHDAGRVARFHALGVRLLGLNHLLHNELADSATDPRGPEWGGLSPFGREVVAECNRLGVVLDASHASDDALWQLLEHSRTPPLLTHSGCRAICDHPRNVGDALLRALAAKGGVIQINALPMAVVAAPEDGRTAALAALLLRWAEVELTPETRPRVVAAWEAFERAYPPAPCTLADYLRQVEHAVAVAGIDHVGIGCDFDGGGGVAGLDEVSDFPRLTRELRARGWSEEHLAKLWGQNTLRVLRAAESEAEGARSGEHPAAPDGRGG